MMMELKVKVNLQQALQVYNHDTKEYSYMVESNGEWVEITEDEYNQLLEADK